MQKSGLTRTDPRRAEQAMAQDTEYLVEKANHCIRLARLIKDASIKGELQSLAQDLMAEADGLRSRMDNASRLRPGGRERRYA